MADGGILSTLRTPVDTSGDECRYCDACGWFGDNTETARTPDMAKVYPVWAVVQALALYRTMCRDELQAEQYCERGRTLDGNDSMLASLKRIQREVRNTACVLVGLYIAYGSLDAKPLMVLHRNNDCVPGPPTGPIATTTAASVVTRWRSLLMRGVAYGNGGLGAGHTAQAQRQDHRRRPAVRKLWPRCNWCARASSV